MDWESAVQGVVEPAPGTTRVTIRLDDDVLEWFRAQVEGGVGVGYQTLMNRALRGCMLTRSGGELEALLRRVVAEELDARRPPRRKRAAAGKRKAS